MIICFTATGILIEYLKYFCTSGMANGPNYPFRKDGKNWSAIQRVHTVKPRSLFASHETEYHCTHLSYLQLTQGSSKVHHIRCVKIW